MKKQMKRTVYEAPVTELFRVELEGGFMAGSAIAPETQNGTINDHEVNTDFGGDQFTDSGWDAE
ncbi:MAG: hypothetical protein E7120_02995 [Bacteroidales bacterium]|nr:hypothetical protein [Bacteroidales bacterium]